MAHPFKLARVAHGQRNQMDTGEEITLQAAAQARRQVLAPGLDWATAWSMVKASGGVRVPVTVRVKKFERGIAFEHEEQQSVEVVSASMMTSIVLDTMPDLPNARTATDLQTQADLARASVGFAVFMHESWNKLHYIVRYFDLVEKNEAPDTPLLEWLIMVGAVDTETAKKTVEQFRAAHKLGRTLVVLDDEDLQRLQVAIDVRLQLEAEEEAKRREIAGND